MTEKFNPFTLEGKSILVTGASSGIGRATAIVCSKMGASLLITGRNEQRLNETFNELKGENHHSIIADLSTSEGRRQLLDHVEKSMVSFTAPVFQVTKFSNF